METVSTLKNLGLSDQEAEIYIELLRLGGSQASVLAKSIGLKRTTVYPILKKLADSGFVTVYFRKNRRYYYAQKPQRVAALFGKKLDAFYAMIPLLNSFERKENQATGLRFIETLEELKQFYIGILDEYRGRSYRIIGSASGWEDLDQDWFRQYRYDRARNGISTQLLLTADSQDVNPEDPSLLRTVRFLPPSTSFRSTIDLFDDKILIVSPDLASLAIVIDIFVMTDVFSGIFETLWSFCETDTLEVLN